MTHTPMQAYQGNAILLATGHAWAINPDGMTPQQKNQLRNEIVTACNSHASLVEALEKCWEYFDNRYDGAPDAHCQDMIEPMEAAQKALQLARGGK